MVVCLKNFIFCICCLPCERERAGTGENVFFFVNKDSKNVLDDIIVFCLSPGPSLDLLGVHSAPQTHS